MLETAKIVTTGLFATLAMTLFSYVFSWIYKQNFREPELLNLLLDRLPKVNFNIAKEHIIGWAVHISIGCLFVFIFILLREFYTIVLNLKTAVVFGVIAGTFGAGVWRLFFALHPDPPQTKKWWFLFHLIFAHIVFGLVMVWSLKKMQG